MLVGLVVTAPIAALTGVPSALHGSALVWLIVSGAGNVCGLIVNYYALRIGQVSVVAPIVSTEGAIAATISVVTGQSLAVSVALTLVMIVVGVVLASVPAPDLAAHEAARHPRTIALAVATAGLFGVSLYATGRAGALLPASWVVLSARLIGVVVLALPLVVSGRLRLTARAAPLVVASGLAEIAGFMRTPSARATVSRSQRSSPHSSRSWPWAPHTCCSASGSAACSTPASPACWWASRC